MATNGDQSGPTPAERERMRARAMKAAADEVTRIQEKQAADAKAAAEATKKQRGE